jgi:predicted nucleic acid-binding protein
MKYLLDTTVLVNHLRGKKPIKIDFLEKGCGVSIITQAELFYGVYKYSNSLENLKKIKAMFFDLGIEVIPLNERIIEHYAKIKAKLEKEGKRLDEFDLLIAATAIEKNLILVSDNLSHFKRISSLKVINQ